MSDREVRSVAGVLLKEATYILKKHERRIAPAPCAAIRESVARLGEQRERKDWAGAREQIEVLDELLHQHASFARKGVFRELVENISIAVLVALALRSCFYEPFKIPSGSMMPTLRNGDHIFVNKFVYGVQIPFTTTVVGESLGDVQRGDVVVFRYPIDESEDFIKRVMGLPGDVVRVDGAEVAIKRVGSDTFEVLPRTKLDQPCMDESGTQEVSRCALYEENNGERTYVVRYEPNFDPRTGSVATRRGEWEVPEGHLLVMGDNRNHSHDSLAWTRVVEAVSSEGLISQRDLRDLTTETLFKATRPERSISDASYDHVIYFAEHRSPKHGVEISVWRSPVLGLDAVYDTAAAALGAGVESVALMDLLDGDSSLRNQARKQAQLERAGAALTRLVVADQGEDGFDAVARLNDADAVIAFRCGRAVCKSRALLGRRLSNMIDGFIGDPAQDARELSIGETGTRYSQHWTSRGRVADKFIERRYTRTGDADAPRAETLRLRAWRDTDEGETFLRDAALRSIGSSTSIATSMADSDSKLTNADAWLAEDDDALTLVASYKTAGINIMLECGRQLCADDARLFGLAREVEAKVPAAARDRRRLPELLPPSEVEGWKHVPVAPEDESQKYEFDRLRLDGTVRTEQYSAEIWVQRVTGERVDEAVRAFSDGLGDVEPDASIAERGVRGTTRVGLGYVFPVRESDVVVRVDCNAGLCPKEEDARALAQRAHERALDPSNFIDPNAERPSPYVPRGNVKGRADRIWLPLRRFWLPIR